MSEPSASRAMESGPSVERRATSRRRVSSPSAAKIGTAAFAVDVFALSGLAHILLDEADDDRPAFAIRVVGLGTPREREAFEPRLGDGQPRPALDLVELEDDERRRLV